MRIAILGAGAVGCHYGAKLISAGAEVRFLARGAHLDALRHSGLWHSSPAGEQRWQIEAQEDPTLIEGCDVLVLACKMTGLAPLLSQIAAHTADEMLLVTLQNGVLAPQWVAERFPGRAVVAGSAFIGVRLSAPGQVRHTAAGHLRLGHWQLGRGSHRLSKLVALWRSADVPVQIEEQMAPVLWNKLLWNCGFNAITALTHRYARDIASDTGCRQLALSAMQETERLARFKGIYLPDDAVEKQVRDTLNGGEVKSSMWQDIEAGRMTEIDWLNGFVADECEKNGLSAPVNRMLCTLVRTLEASHAGR